MTLGGDWSELDDDDELDRMLSAVRNIPIRCDDCGYLLIDRMKPISERGYYETECSAGQCIELRCARCCGVWSSWGPVMCPSCSGVPWWYMSMWIFNYITYPISRTLRRLFNVQPKKFRL